MRGNATVTHPLLQGGATTVDGADALSFDRRQAPW
jgi:hypothetical protein